MNKLAKILVAMDALTNITEKVWLWKIDNVEEIAQDKNKNDDGDTQYRVNDVETVHENQSEKMEMKIDNKNRNAKGLLKKQRNGTRS